MHPRRRINDVDGTNSESILHIPSLEEYIRICKRYGKKCILELKNKFEPENIRQITNMFSNLGYSDGVVYISFFEENLITLREILPEQRLQYLISEEISDKLVRELVKYSFDIDVNYEYIISEETVEMLHNNGISVNCWTVNDAETAEKLVSWNVDYITTNILE